MDHADGRAAPISLHSIHIRSIGDGYHPVHLEIDHGVVLCRYYQPPAPKGAALWVGGIGGGWDTPAAGLYPRLCSELVSDGIASLRVRFRHPTDLDASVFDLSAGLTFLQNENLSNFALVGHSLGGAVIIQAAVRYSEVRTVVTLSTQGQGTGAVSQLAPHCSILLIHGTADRVLRPSNSDYVYQRAHEPKRLLLYEAAGHGLDEAAAEVHEVVRDWIIKELTGTPA